MNWNLWRYTMSLLVGRLAAMAAIGMLTAPSALMAQDGTWTNTAGGSWPDTGNWNGNIIADGADNTANFGTLDIAADATITLDGARTIGNLTFGDATTPSNNWILNSGSGGPLTLDVTAGSPTFSVINQSVTTGVVLAGSDGLIKTGDGTLILNANNTFTGGLTINAGTVAAIGSNVARLPNGSAVTVNAGGAFDVRNTNAIPTGGNALNFTLNGGTLTSTGNSVTHVHAGDVSMNSGATWTHSGTGNYNGERFQMNGDVTVTGGTAVASTISGNQGIGLVDVRTFTVDDVTGNADIDLNVSAELEDNDGGAGDGIIKAGNGTMALSGGSSYSGTTSVNGGTLLVNSSLRNTSSLTVNSGATLELGATNIFTSGHGAAMADSRVITADGGTLLMNGNMDSRFGNVTLTNGATWTSNRGLGAWDALLADTSAGAATVTVSGSGASVMNGSGGIHLQGVQNFDVADTTGDGAADLTVSMILGSQGNAAGAAGGINKLGAGTMAISKQTTYTGGTTVSAGVLDLTGGGGSGGTIRGTVTVNSGATLRLSTGDATGYGTGADRLSTINLDGGTMHVAVGGSGNNQTLGNATINMTGASITGIAGSNIDFFQGNSTLNTLASATTSTIGGVDLSPLRQGSTTFTVADGAAAVDLQIDSVIRTSPSGDPAGAVLTKAGDGTMSLTAANTIARDFSVAAGTLLLNNTAGSATGTGNVGVLGGATLGGDGSTSGAVTMALAAILSPGNSPGSLGTGALTLADTTLLNWELDTANQGNTTASDRVDVTGNLILDGILNVTALGGFGTPIAGDRWRLFNYSGSLTDNAVTFGTLPSLNSGLIYQIDTGTGGQVDLLVSVVPEPGSLALMLFGMGTLFAARRTRRRK